MDFKAKESSWQAKATSMFKRGATSSHSSTSHVSQENTQKYKRALNKKIKVWWTKITLENYVAQNIVPRGLRINIYPTFDLGEETLINRWIAAANTCSLEFIKIIIEKNSIILKNIETEIEDLQKILLHDMRKEEFQEFVTKLDKDIEKWENHISLNKQKKYERDWADFESKRIFKWQMPKKKDPIPRNLFRDLSTSNSSISDVGSSTFEASYKPRTRQQYKKSAAPKNQVSDTVEVINLSSHILTDAQTRVLQRGLTFSPSSDLDSFTAIKDLHLFSRKLVLKRLHHKKESGGDFSSREENEALEILESLIDENTSNFYLMVGYQPQYIVNPRQQILYFMLHRHI
ncbi:uncharacterized protein [Dendrobates tinctorius]|uniref:uncharacterized protein n=1 Tax=Dendrobates tinctorius TaxID=92724 RepID=UPI003CC95F00